MRQGSLSVASYGLKVVLLAVMCREGEGRAGERKASPGTYSRVTSLTWLVSVLKPQ